MATTESSADTEEEETTIVIDNGSGWMKVGFANETKPRSVFSTIIGRPRHVFVGIGMAQKDAYVGDEAISKRGILNLAWTIHNGIIGKWDNIEKIWHHCFYNELRACPEEHPVLMTETIFNPSYNRERMTQILFESFNVPSMYSVIQNVLSLYAQGKVNGIVMECGDSVTNVVPIYEGHILKHAAGVMDIGGRDLTDYLMKTLTESGYSFTTSAEREIVRNIKETLAYTALDYDKEMEQYASGSDEKNPVDKNYKLPDGQIITIGSQRFRSSEVLFNPELIGKECNGVDVMIHESISESQMENVDMLYSNIFLCGGSSMFPNFRKRVQKELCALTDNRNSCKINVIAPENRKYSAWIGGSIVSNLTTFKELFIDKDAYDEEGPTIIHRKCF